MATITSIDSVILVVAMLSQFAATVLVVRHNEWGKSFTETRQWGSVAAVTTAFTSFLGFIIYWRSKRQIGGRLSSSGKLIVYYAVMVLFLPVFAGWNCYDSIDRLWITALDLIIACCVIDLTRSEMASEFLLMFLFPLNVVVVRTDGFLYWRIGVMIMAVASIALMTFRESQFVDMKEAEDLRKNEIKKTQESIKVY